MCCIAWQPNVLLWWKMQSLGAFATHAVRYFGSHLLDLGLEQIRLGLQEYGVGL